MNEERGATSTSSPVSNPSATQRSPKGHKEVPAVMTKSNDQIASSALLAPVVSLTATQPHAPTTFGALTSAEGQKPTISLSRSIQIAAKLLKVLKNQRSTIPKAGPSKCHQVFLQMGPQQRISVLLTAGDPRRRCG
jgi:hypothetical protein